MLVLSRRTESTIHIGANVQITVLEIRKGRVKLGIDAPSKVTVLRGELLPAASGSHPAAAFAGLRPTANATAAAALRIGAGHCSIAETPP